MFDIGWYELLIIGVVALLVVGPKELPTLLRTVGRYVGMMRRQAAEFRDQFDQAMRESELDKIKQEMEKSTEEATTAIRDAESALDRDLDSARRDMDVSGGEPLPSADAAEIAAGASATDAVAPAAVPPVSDAGPSVSGSPVADAAARAAARSAPDGARTADAAPEATETHAAVNGTKPAAGMNGAGKPHLPGEPVPAEAGESKA